MTDNLAFALLDRRIIDGDASDDIIRFVELSAAYGGALRQLGVAAGDLVIVVNPIDDETLIALLGVLRIGAVATLGGDSGLDVTSHEFLTLISVGRTDPAGSKRIADSDVVIEVRGAAWTHAELVSYVLDGEQPPEALSETVETLRSLRSIS